MVIFFYLFATLLIISSIMVVLSQNPVYSVLWLIFTFCNGSGLMILLGAEFLALMLIIIYVGAVAVLFLFVVMMLDIKLNRAIMQFKANLLLGSIVALIMFADLVCIILLATKQMSFSPDTQFTVATSVTNTKAIGLVLYTDFILPFQISGVTLFVAMISCITLTMRKRGGIKRQDIGMQNSKTKANSIVMTTPAVNKGIEEIKYD